MTDEKAKQCKMKDCTNDVLEGKYCEYCKQVRKGKRNKILGGAAAVGVSAAGYAVKKGVLRQVPKILGSVFKIILKK